MAPPPLINFEIQTYYQNEPRLIGVYSRDNLPNKIKDGEYVINLAEYYDIGTYDLDGNYDFDTVIYFEIYFDNRNIISNIYRIQNCDSIMFGYFCIGFIDYMFKGKSLTDYTNLFSPDNFKKNDDIIKLFSKQTLKMVEIKSIESVEHNFIDTPNLNNQQFRLNEISEIE